MPESKIGQTIQIEEKHKNAVKALIDNCDDAHVAFHRSSRLVKTTNKDLWDFLENIYPELSKYEGFLNHKDLVVTLIKEKNLYKGGFERKEGVNR